MADERYQKLLGIEPADEIPTYYELFEIELTETDESVIEGAYKTQIRKLQAIRTSKDKGFIEFLKEELRKARRILTNPQKRKEYDASLLEDSLENFKEFVQPLMALGHITKSVYDTMVAKGVSDGLAEDKAQEVIETMAKEHNATLDLSDEPEAPVDDAYGDDAYAEEPSGDELFSDDDPYGDPYEAPRPSGEVVLEAPADYEPPERKPARASEFYGSAGTIEAEVYTPTTTTETPAAQQGPWFRANEESPWGRRGPRRRRRPVPRAGGSGMGAVAPAASVEHSEADKQELGEAVRIFNLGAKLAKIASDVHQKLKFYFPPANGKTTRTKQINGVSYEKVFDTEQKMYRDTLKKFETAHTRLGALQGGLADALRQRSTQNIALVKGYLDEIRQHKLRRLAGLSKDEELRTWQEFVGNRRSARITQMLAEPK